MIAPLRVTCLRCEYLVEPLGIDERVPRLSWQLEGERRGARQAAYRVRVASSLELLRRGLADLWDSGRVESDRATHVGYAGRALSSRQSCHWLVDVWDEVGRKCQSDPAFWSMGLLARDDWTARWIAADPESVRRDPGAVTATLARPGTPAIFRKEFELPTGVKRATVYVSARGVLELRANGRRVGDDLFAPEWTDYHQRIQYRTYDLTELLGTGVNALGVTLGDGWWSGYVGWQETRCRYGSLENSLILQLEAELDDGRRLVVASDRSFRCECGPIVTSDFMMGELYDARRERPGWDRPGFDDTSWLAAREVAAPAAVLVAQRAEPVRITERRPAVSLSQPSPGVFVYDLGQNFAGWVRLTLPPLPAGTRIVVRHGERLTAEGALYTENLRRAESTDVYVARGDASGESYEPHFTFHGFQYVELSGFPAGVSPALSTVLGCVIHSGTPPAGTFECSHPGVNRLWLNGAWSQRSNFLSVPTDCPQRDERLGWTGDAQVFLRTATYNRDVAAFFTKWMIDVEDAQTAEGIFPDTAPRLREDDNFVGLRGLGGAAAWGDAGVLIPYTLWQVYGDRRILARHYDAMSRWVDWIAAQNPSGLRVNGLGNNYGDWLCIPSDTSFGTHSPMKCLLATAYFATDCAKLAEIARELGRAEDASRFRARFELVRAAFQREWLQPDGKLRVDTQTAYLLALAFDLLPDELRAAAAGHLVANIRDLNFHLSCGFVGVSHLNPQLSLAGYADVAYRLLLRDDYPSWLYPVLHGATTIWERWNGWTEQEGFFNPHMNSFNHYSLGSVGEWLYRHVAGIELDPERPGFQHFVLRPFLGEGVSFARASYRTLHGVIESSWHWDGRHFRWTFRVPPNCTAKVYLPAQAPRPLELDSLSWRGEGAAAHLLAPAGRYTVASQRLRRASIPRVRPRRSS